MTRPDSMSYVFPEDQPSDHSVGSCWVWVGCGGWRTSGASDCRRILGRPRPSSRLRRGVWLLLPAKLCAACCYGGTAGPPRVLKWSSFQKMYAHGTWVCVTERLVLWASVSLARKVGEHFWSATSHWAARTRAWLYTLSRHLILVKVV